MPRPVPCLPELRAEVQKAVHVQPDSAAYRAQKEKVHQLKGNLQVQPKLFESSPSPKAASHLWPRAVSACCSTFQACNPRCWPLLTVKSLYALTEVTR